VDEMDRAYSTHVREEECIEGFGWKSRRREDLDIGDRVIL
jgi:hypothetical protein